MDNDKLLRYSRQMMLPEIDAEGQQRLADARVLIIGLGGLGSSSSVYLAAAGVGHLVLVDFDEVDINYSVIEIAGKMWNHEPDMWDASNEQGLTFPVFKSGEMADVVAYIYELKLIDPPGNINLGSEIVVKRGCLTCHSINNKGADIASDLTDIDLIDSPLDMVTAMWNHAPSMNEEIIVKEIDWPELNSEDVANIFAYLNSLSKEEKKY